MTRSSAEFRIEPPYDRVFTGLLSFSDLVKAEDTLRKLEDLREGFSSEGDKKGVEYCRRLAVLGRQRAEMISRNPRVSLHQRSQKGEIAFWFKVWLETPEIFHDWLALRKKSDDFKKLLR